MRILVTLILLFSLSGGALACDLTQPDKLKHIEISRQLTVGSKKALRVVFLPIRPVKWIFNDKIQLIFPDNYVPEILAGTLVFTAGVLKEVPYDVVIPGHKVEFCDIVADCHGIMEGVKKEPAR